MTTVVSSTSLRLVDLGRYVATSSYSLAVETKTLFTITGLVAVTSLVGVVGTAITVANTVKLQANPTTGATGDLCAATDIGTTDTPAGDLLSITGVPGDSLQRNVGYAQGFKQLPLIVNAGTIEQVTATGADGAVTWYLTYVPYSSDGSVVAAF